MELPRTGEVFEERYALLGVLGQGGFATVYRAHDTSMARDVVIKVLSPDSGAAARIRSRFMREARVFAELQDPHTITMFDFGSTATGLLYMVFEFVDGRDLAKILEERGTLPPDVVVHIVLQLLSALQEAHSRGVLHRDIKPANILIYAYGDDPFRVKLIDFGIAKDTSPEASRLTKTGGIVGTLRYMAPEQFASDTLGPDTDLFCLGLVACEMLTGVRVISGSSQRELVMQQMSDEPILVPERAAPAGLRAVIDRMMERERPQRFPSAAAVMSALKQLGREPEPVFAGPLPVLADPPLPPTETRPPNPWLVIVAVAVVVAAVGIVGAEILRRSEPSPPSPRIVALPMAAPALPAPTPVLQPNTESVVDATLPGADACGQPPPFTGLGRIAFVGARAVSGYLPKAYDGTQRLPVVLMFHRLWRSGRSMLDDVQIPRLAEEHGFIALAYDTSGAQGWRKGQIDDVLDDLEVMHEHLCIDRSRLYVIGDEAGAWMASELPCRTPISAYAAGFNRTAAGCKPIVGTARMRFFGGRDKNIPLDGSLSCVVVEGPSASAATMEKAWKTRHECTGRAKRWGREFEGAECLTWDCAVGPFVSCKTDGGHHWPGTHSLMPFPNCDVTPPEHEFPLSDAIWTFFEREGHAITDAELNTVRQKPEELDDLGQ